MYTKVSNYKANTHVSPPRSRNRILPAFQKCLMFPAGSRLSALLLEGTSLILDNHLLIVCVS